MWVGGVLKPRPAALLLPHGFAPAVDRPRWLLLSNVLVSLTLSFSCCFVRSKRQRLLPLTGSPEQASWMMRVKSWCIC